MAANLRVVGQENVNVVSPACLSRWYTVRQDDAPPVGPSCPGVPVSAHPAGAVGAEACESAMMIATNAHSPSVTPVMSMRTDVPPPDPETDVPMKGAPIPTAYLPFS